MTIKEIEALSGMERANIRFYEQQGLLTPARRANGYRDYSPQDLDTLLRVQLLRSLHISLEEIKGLAAGDNRLSDILDRQIKRLEQEQQGARRAQAVCRRMQREQAQYQDLDARKYLEEIHAGPPEEENPYFAVQGDAMPQVFHPWRRFFARMLDLNLYNLFYSSILALVFHVNLSLRGTGGKVLDGIAVLLLMVFLEPLWLHIGGTTPGKCIFGLRVETAGGDRPTYGQGLARTWGVLAQGMGFGIPFYRPYRLWKSYRACSREEPQPWEDELAYTMRDAKWYRGVWAAAAFGAMVGLLAVVMAWAQLPPNRGRIDPAAFAENYNYMAAYLGLEPAYKLNADGRWEAVPPVVEGVTQVPLVEAAQPDFIFRTGEDGQLEGVSFHIRVENAQDWVDPGTEQMALAALAYAGAQRQLGPFSHARRDMVEQLQAGGLEGCRLEVAGVQITCRVACTGFYEPGFGVLIPEAEGAPNYYRLDFTMTKG